MDIPQTPSDSTTPSPDQTSSKSGFGTFGHVVAFLACVGLPGFVSLIAPVSWVKFERRGDSVSANAKVCLFFLIPYRNQTVSEVGAVDYRVHQAQRSSSTFSRNQSPPDPEGFLVIHGDDGKRVEVPVTPSKVESVRDKARAFLQDSRATELKLVVFSSWMLSLLVSGLLSLLTLLYLFNGLVLIIQGVQRFFGVEPQNLFFAARPESGAKTSMPKRES